MADYRGDNTTGFQSPAQDYVEPVIDLAARLDLGRPHIYPVRVVGQALAARGIHDGDVLVANAAAHPKSGKVCVAIMNGDVVLATLRNERRRLVAASLVPSLTTGQRRCRNLGGRRSARSVHGVSVLALIDANNFYCSCERAFDPRLRGRPLVVLSNNDGCVISRSNEAKELGLKMAEPWHLVKDRPALRGVEWRSSNYALYGDMSRRVYQVLCGLVPGVEPYSIDEMFLDFGGMHKPGELALRIRDAVQRATKIPTCVGIGPTKTIAKLANAVAKMDRAGSGVCDLSNAGHRVTVYKKLSVDQGVGTWSCFRQKARSSRHQDGCGVCSTSR